MAGIVLFAAPARPVLTLLSEQVRRAFVQDGALSAEEQRSLELLERQANQVHGSQPTTPEGMPLGLPPEYWQSLNQVDAVSTARELSCPMLFLQGGSDVQVTESDWSSWKASLSNQPNVTFLHYPPLDHLGMPVAEPGHPSSAQVSDELIRDVAAWIAHASRGLTC